MFKYKVGDIILGGGTYRVKIIKTLIHKNGHRSYELISMHPYSLLCHIIDSKILEEHTRLDPVSQRKQKLEKLNVQI